MRVWAKAPSLYCQSAHDLKVVSIILTIHLMSKVSFSVPPVNSIDEGSSQMHTTLIDVGKGSLQMHTTLIDVGKGSLQMQSTLFDVDEGSMHMQSTLFDVDEGSMQLQSTLNYIFPGFLL